MNKTTRNKIEDAVEKVAAADDAHEWAVAGAVLRTQTSDVLYELAAAALVDAARNRRRRGALTVERDAEVPSEMHESDTPFRRPKYGTGAYRRWVESTAEGAAYDEERAEWEARGERRRAEALAGVLDEYRESLHIEWTAELLDTEFALGDGTRVTWGEATAEQHRSRAELFANNAAANLEGAARHQKAVAALLESGASTLRDLVGVAA